MDGGQETGPSWGAGFVPAARAAAPPTDSTTNSAARAAKRARSTIDLRAGAGEPGRDGTSSCTNERQPVDHPRLTRRSPRAYVSLTGDCRGAYDVEPAGVTAPCAPVETKEEPLARAKQTDRAEARRRYRQTQADPPADDAPELDFGERRTDIGAKAKATTSSGGSPSGRMGIGAAFRAAYHPAHVREDLRLLPVLVRSRAFLAGAGLVLAGGAVYAAFPRMTGGQLAWDLLVLPSSALVPQLVVGFFAPRASYLLGLMVGILQAGIYAVLLPTFVAVAIELGATVTADQVQSSRVSGLLNGPVVGLLFASMAAWYRRFLSLSSPRRPAGGRAPAKSNQSRRPAGR